MSEITAEACKDVIRKRNMTFIGHHRCQICGTLVGYQFTPAQQEGNDEIFVAFQSSCDCAAWQPPQPRTWENFTDEFNRHTPEIRERMWARFQDGKALFEKT